MTDRRFAVELTHGASRDLGEIADRLATLRGRDDAAALLDRFLDTIGTLERFPLRGAVPAELDALGIFEFRQILLDHYRLIYRVIGERVVILVGAICAPCWNAACSDHDRPGSPTHWRAQGGCVIIGAMAWRHFSLLVGFACLGAMTPCAASAQAADPPAMAPMGMMAGTMGPYSMMQDASGTAWQPASTPMAGMMWGSGGWSGMVHGYADLVYDHQSGPRGDSELFSESMAMVMAQHSAGPGTLTLKSMLSLDPLMGPGGYPLLLQTGETANGTTPLIDRQHPHNLFMEMAGVYAAPLAPRSSVFVYLGYPGEPALGPVTFMHRFSGQDDPAAPITHHWLDSTHITFGVATAGVVEGRWKIEASLFNGREPDQHRWGYQPLKLDSWSGRITFNPAADWSFQVSYGALHSPEQLTPEVNQQRLTASGTWNRRIAGGNWQTTLAWGQNRDEPGHVLQAVLFESALALGPHTLFARGETVQKDDLLPAPAAKVFRVSETTLGYVYDIAVARHVALGIGMQGTIDFVPASLRAAYGAAEPTGVMPFVRLKVR